MLENPICAVNRMSRCYWLDTGGRLRPNHVKRTDLGREPLFLTKSTWVPACGSHEAFEIVLKKRALS
jgi:hypothetical protein